MKIIETTSECDNATIGIIASRYNQYIVQRLINGCIQALEQNSISQNNIVLVRVPGAFEIPFALDQLVQQKKHDGYITLGAVIRGETPHFDYICAECAHGINQVSLQYHVPVAFGVLTVDNIEQAMDRSGEEESNKGAEAALTLLEMINIAREIKGG